MNNSKKRPSDIYTSGKIGMHSELKRRTIRRPVESIGLISNIPSLANKYAEIEKQAYEEKK